MADFNDFNIDLDYNVGDAERAQKVPNPNPPKNNYSSDLMPNYNNKSTSN